MELKVNNISKRYATQLAVDDLSFHVDSGEIFALLGPNGAGKSSTIRMLIGLTLPDSGDIAFSSNEFSGNQLPMDAYGYLPEDRGLYQDKGILDTLVFIGQLKGLSATKAKSVASHWLSLFELEDRQKEQLKTLSKGNQQKVQLIASIINEPKIVFLDEPFSGLDPVNQEKVIEFLYQLQQKGVTIILSAHQMSLVEKVASRFMLMNKGKSVLYGDLDTIRETAQIGDQLTIKFANEVASDSFESMTGVDKVTSQPDNQLQLDLKFGCDIPQLLRTILEQHEIVNLHTQRASLHDIYLNTVKESGDE